MPTNQAGAARVEHLRRLYEDAAAVDVTWMVPARRAAHDRTLDAHLKTLRQAERALARRLSTNPDSHA